MWTLTHDIHYLLQHIVYIWQPWVCSNCPLFCSLPVTLLQKPAASTNLFVGRLSHQLSKGDLQAASRLSLSHCRQFWTMSALPWGFTLHWDARDHCVTSLSYIFAACSNIHIMSWCLCPVVVSKLWGCQHCFIVVPQVCSWCLLVSNFSYMLITFSAPMHGIWRSSEQMFLPFYAVKIDLKHLKQIGSRS